MRTLIQRIQCLSAASVVPVVVKIVDVLDEKWFGVVGQTVKDGSQD